MVAARGGVRAVVGGVAATALGTALTAVALVPAGGAQAATGGGFQQVDLVSDVPGMAQLTDPAVVNPWGIALGPTTPLWVANNGTSTATIYTGANGSDPVSKVRLTVTTPAQPTGQVFNSTSAFALRGKPAPFLFDTLSQRVAAWSPQVPPPTLARTTARVANHVYLGLAIARTGQGPRLLAADGGGRIDVFDTRYRLIAHPRTFTDPMLPRGLGPYNVAVLGNRVYVSYAPAPGATASVDGAINVFDLNGRLVRRLVTGGPLEEPWGMVMAPAHWGRFGGMLLVGNEDGGRINAFDPATGAFRGTLRDAAGAPLANDGLWGLAFGNGAFGTPRTLIFAAGIDEYTHGLVGTISPN